MNILILNWRDPQNPQSGGAEKVTEKYASALVKRGHSVTWFSTLYPGARNRELKAGIEFIRRGNILTQFFWAPYYYFKTKKFEVVIDQIHGFPYMTPLFVKEKKIAFIHEVAGDIWNKMFPFPINVIGRELEKICFRFYKSTPFITVSNSTKKELAELQITDVTIIENGLDSTQPDHVQKEDQPTLLYLSRIVKMKGIEDVIKSFSYTLKTFPTAKLWIVGSGNDSYITFLKNQADSLGVSKSISFFGSVSETEKYLLMKRAHLLLHASTKEGWGLVIIEAASQGTPSIVYNVAGLRDSVKDGVTGKIVSENTPESLAKSAIDLLGNKKLYRKMSLEAKSWSLKFSWEKSIKRFITIIESHT